MPQEENKNALSDPDPAQLVSDQFVALFLQQNKRAQTGILISAILVYLLLTYRTTVVWAPVWLAVVGLVSAIRFSWTGKLLGNSSQPIRLISSLLLLNGFCLAVPVLAFGEFSDVDKAFLSIVLIALATASVATTSGYQAIFLWFAATLLVPLSAAWTLSTWLDESAWTGRGLSALIIIYLLFLTALGRDAFRVFDESCRIRFGEHELNGKLAAALHSAQSSSQAKTRFLAAASHDLRQPLHTIGVLVAALGSRRLDDRSREIVDLMATVSDSLSGQLDGLLDISKLDAGIVQPVLRPESIDQIVHASVASLKAFAAERGLHIRTHSPERLMVSTDANLLGRILANLAGNGLKFTHQGGVDITMSRLDGNVCIEVADTGMGIAVEQQQLVFQEFYQVGNSERDRSRGLGLGLAIVHRLCLLMNIGLTLDSSPGKGSRFTLLMPLIDGAHWTAAKPNDAMTTEMAGFRILVIDDEVAVRDGMRLLLEEMGCVVLLAADVEQACRHVQDGPIGMVISDFRLQGETSGIDAIRQLRHAQPGVYALVVSGDTAPDRLQQAHAADIPLLHKPVAINELVRHLHKAKEQHER